MSKASTLGKQTASAIQNNHRCSVSFIKLVEAGADSTLTLYDTNSTGTSEGRIIDYLEVASGDGAVGGPLTTPLEFKNGVYAVLTGASAYYFIHTV